ncbi:MAG: hypothetical protein ACLQVY_24315 [Limisphaerales bacterium]
MLTNLGDAARAWDDGASLVIVGRNALKDNTAVAAKLEPGESD